jgi:hypothetical protein
MCLCVSIPPVEEIARNKVSFWRRTSHRQEPSIPELTIMISDVPKKIRSQVALRITELTSNRNETNPLM